MLLRSLARSLLLLGLASACASPLPRWHVSASVGGCEQHYGILVADAEGVIREVDDVHALLGARIDALPELLVIERGGDGWWLRGSVEHVRHLWWLADDAHAPELVATGDYVGVVATGSDTLGLRSLSWGGWGAAQRWALVIDRLERGASGWTVTQLQRFNDVRPGQAIADEQGRPLVFAWLPGWSFEEYVLLRVEGDTLRPVGLLPSTLGNQLSRAADGQLLLSTPIPAGHRWADEREPTLVLRKRDDDHYVHGALVRACTPERLPASAELPEPLRIGLIVHQGDAVLLPTYGDLGEVVDRVNTLPRPLELFLGGIELRGQADELLRLEPGVRLETLVPLPAIAGARPDLFERPDP